MARNDGGPREAENSQMYSKQDEGLSYKSLKSANKHVSSLQALDERGGCTLTFLGPSSLFKTIVYTPNILVTFLCD